MPNYDLDRLGEKEFERLFQSLIKSIIGTGTVTFGAGRDGGREATYTGEAPFHLQLSAGLGSGFSKLNSMT